MCSLFRRAVSSVCILQVLLVLPSVDSFLPLWGVSRLVVRSAPPARVAPPAPVSPGRPPSSLVSAQWVLMAHPQILVAPCAAWRLFPLRCGWRCRPRQLPLPVAPLLPSLPVVPTFFVGLRFLLLSRLALPSFSRALRYPAFLSSFLALFLLFFVSLGSSVFLAGCCAGRRVLLPCLRPRFLISPGEPLSALCLSVIWPGREVLSLSQGACPRSLCLPAFVIVLWDSPSLCSLNVFPLFFLLLLLVCCSILLLALVWSTRRAEGSFGGSLFASVFLLVSFDFVVS